MGGDGEWVQIHENEKGGVEIVISLLLIDMDALRLRNEEARAKT